MTSKEKGLSFIRATGKLRTDIESVRLMTTQIAAHAADSAAPEILEALACIEEKLRIAESALATNSRVVFRWLNPGGQP